jgi:ribosomal protein S18 acetylase RimI-like enzyme
MSTLAVVRFDASHLPGVLALCDAEGWPSLPSDPGRAETMLTAPDATAVVAEDSGAVVGFAFAFMDAGGVDAYLSTLAVHSEYRRQGVARRLVAELFRLSGAERVDLLAEPGSEPFYDSWSHRRLEGYRLYPDSK